MIKSLTGDRFNSNFINLAWILICFFVRRCPKPVKDAFPRRIWRYACRTLQFGQHGFHAKVLSLHHKPLVKLGIFGHIRLRSNASAKIREDMLKSLCIRVDEVNLSSTVVFIRRPRTERAAEPGGKVGRAGGQRRFVRVEELTADV